MQRVVLLFILVFGFIACDDIIEVVDISNETVSIIAPTDKSVVDTTSVIFTWNPVEDAETYQVQVATPTFENAAQIVLDTIVTKTNFTKTMEPKIYEWRMRAKNSNYQTSYITTAFVVEE